MSKAANIDMHNVAISLNKKLLYNVLFFLRWKYQWKWKSILNYIVHLQVILLLWKAIVMVIIAVRFVT